MSMSIMSSFATSCRKIFTFWGVYSPWLTTESRGVESVKRPVVECKAASWRQRATGTSEADSCKMCPKPPDQCPTPCCELYINRIFVPTLPEYCSTEDPMRFYPQNFGGPNQEPNAEFFENRVEQCGAKWATCKRFHDELGRHGEYCGAG